MNRFTYICQYILLVYILLSPCAVAAQGDSLLLQLQRTPDSQERVDLLNNLSWEMSVSAPEEAFLYASASVELAERLNYDYGRAVALETMGVIFDRRGQSQQAIDYYLEALAIHQSRDDLQSMTGTLTNLGVLFGEMGDIEKEKKYYQEALELGEKLKDNTTIKSSYYLLGIALTGEKRYLEAIDYFKKALETQAQLPMDEADYNAVIYTELAATYQHQGKVEQAEQHLREAIRQHQMISQQEGIASTYNKLTQLYISQEEYDKAIESGRMGGNFSKTIPFNKVQIVALQNLEKIFVATNQMDSAYYYLSQIESLRDSIDRKQDTEMIYRLEERYQSELKESKIAWLLGQQEKQRWKWISLLVGSLSLIGLLLFLIWRQKNKHRQDVKAYKHEQEIRAIQLEKKEQELTHYREQLDLFTRQILQRNEQLMARVDIDQTLETRQQLMETSLLTDKDWDEFRQLFSRLYPDFFQQLALKMPKLSVTEVRLSALLKLDSTQNEIAGILGISVESVRKSLYRLRKKLEVETLTELKHLIASL